MTDANGMYIFSGLDAGNYKVRFILPNGYNWTIKWTGTNTWLDSNADNKWFSDCIFLGTWETNLNIDAWLVLSPSQISCDAITISPIVVTSWGIVSYNCQWTNISTWYLMVTMSGLMSGNTLYIWWLSGTFTINSTGIYIAQCVINSGITYWVKKFEFTKFESCAYKAKPDWSICAVDTSISPYKSDNINFSTLLQLPNPISYCKMEEINFACTSSPKNSQIYTKDETTCRTTFTVTWQINTSTASVWNFVRNDKNQNGIQDSWEEWLSWAKVELYTCSGSNLLATMFTNSSWMYMFTWLSFGNYKVKFYLPNWYNYFTTKNASWSTIDNGSDAWGDWFTDCFVLGTWENRTDIDAWVYFLWGGWGGGWWWGGWGGGWPTNYCGNGRVDNVNWVLEQCDDGIFNGYASSRCNTNCTVKTTPLPTNIIVPKCDYVDPPSINKWELLPFRWSMEKISKNNSWYSSDIYTSSCDANNIGKTNRSTARCEFVIYRANSNGKQEEVVKINMLNCFNNNTNNLITSAINNSYTKMNLIPNFSKFDGYGTRNTSSFDSYGEYIIRLNKVTYESCVAQSTTVNNTTTTTYTRQSNVYNKAVCDFNFAVTKPYILNRWTSMSSVWNTSFADFYGFGNNSNIWNSLNIPYIYVWYSDNTKSSIDTFVNKYQRSNKNSAGKVQNKEIYILDWDYTYTDSKQTQPATIIVKWNLTIRWNITNNIAFIADTIKFESIDCNIPQTINGLYIARNNFVAGTNLQNLSPSQNRCDDGRLLVKGKLIGNDINAVSNSRRSYLNDWFNYDNTAKYQAIINGAAIKIEENAAIWNIPGMNELKSTLSVTK